ncbi:MAG TPA: hypothetical protein PK829_01425 [Promineifilum sp.]|nr:hypothetical protein [Promineifilum sp.]
MNTSDESLPAPAGPSGSRSLLSRSPVLAALAVFLLLAGLILVVSTLLSQDRRPLYPNLPTFTPLSETLASEPAVLTFTELNADPDAYRDRRIQVSGDFASMTPPTCAPFAGPVIRWTLVAEELQLNAVGFENVLRLLAEGTPMTVTGTWRLYRGPAGCGKEPPDANVWYLAVDQILEPNPLLGGGGAALTVIAGSPLPTLPPLNLEAPTEEATPTLEATPAEATPQPTGLPEVSPTAGQPVPITPVGTPTLTETPTATTTVDPLATPTLTATPTTTGTPGPSPTPSATTEGGELTPGIPTATLSGTGYPDDGTPAYP